ncbi:MAG: SDR family NAD(P)-dependent oxidoreductase [Granulosicoccus sp.]
MSERTETIVVFGATSHLAQGCCRLLAEAGHALVLVGRSPERLDSVKNDLAARGATVSVVQADLDDFDGHESLVSTVSDADSFWFFAGSLPDQKQCESTWDATHAAMVTNGISAISLLTRLANVCEQRRAGSFVVISSVAGDRGRSSNYIYGAAKGAVSVFCEGLRGRMQRAGVGVLVIKPGFFISPMTADIEKKPAVLWVEAEQVAKAVVSGWQAGKDVVYAPWFWRPIMRIIREVPTRIFKKLSI